MSLQTIYADEILNQDGENLIAMNVVLEDDSETMVASEHKHQMRKVRKTVGDNIVTRYDRSVEVGPADTWDWVTETDHSFAAA